MRTSDLRKASRGDFIKRDVASVPNDLRYFGGNVAASYGQSQWMLLGRATRQLSGFCHRHWALARFSAHG
jgi:hypothetical protein